MRIDIEAPAEGHATAPLGRAEAEAFERLNGTDRAPDLLPSMRVAG